MGGRRGREERGREEAEGRAIVSSISVHSFLHESKNTLKDRLPPLPPPLPIPLSSSLPLHLMIGSASVDVRP